MNFEVGVFAESQLSGEAVNEVKQALEGIALKYKCRFELKEQNESQGVSGKTTISDQLDSKNQLEKNSVMNNHC